MLIFFTLPSPTHPFQNIDHLMSHRPFISLSALCLDKILSDFNAFDVCTLPQPLVHLVFCQLIARGMVCGNLSNNFATLCQFLNLQSMDLSKQVALDDNVLEQLSNATDAPNIAKKFSFQQLDVSGALGFNVKHVLSYCLHVNLLFNPSC